ncbi:MAG TPA: phage holin family protein [Gemmatimonadaceae bacterium]|nr:phage holin family protein [Gemmatimonadaceae bacterium]
MAVERTDGRRGLGALLRELAEGSVMLVRQELTLAKLELGDAAKHAGAGTAMFAAGGILALLGLLAVLTGVILLIGDQWLPKDLYWVAALLVMLITGAVAWLFAKKGIALLSPRELAPDQTVETLKEDKEWLKHRMTSGATSS